jgi:hypothetical protein
MDPECITLIGLVYKAPECTFIHNQTNIVSLKGNVMISFGNIILNIRDFSFLTHGN